MSRKGFPRWFLGFSLRGLSAEKEEPALAESLQRHEGVVLGGMWQLGRVAERPGMWGWMWSRERRVSHIPL